MCTREMPGAEVAHLVNYISDFKLPEAEWQFGKQPYSRAYPPPPVSPQLFFLFICWVLLCRLISRS